MLECNVYLIPKFMLDLKGLIVGMIAIDDKYYYNVIFDGIDIAQLIPLDELDLYTFHKEPIN